MMNIIHTDKLTSKDLPKEKGKWADIIKFASSFDIHQECSHSYVPIVNLINLNKKSSIEEIRITLYSEWRKYNQLSSDPEWKTLEQIWGAVEFLRIKLKDKESSD